MTAAKFALPRPPGTLPRPALFAACEHALSSAPALWIDGPAGSGKTRLAGSFLEHSHVPARWLNVDAGDRDPVAFFEALADLAPGGDLPDLAVERAFDLDNFARRFFRRWFATAPAGITLVLDDWHVAAGSPVADVLAALIDRIPPDARLVVLSRDAPPSGLARLELNDRLRRIGADALAFSFDDTHRLATQLGLDLSDAALTGIVESTGGWAAGVHLLLAEEIRTPATSLSIRRLDAYLEQELLAPLSETETGLLMTLALVEVLDDVTLGALSDAPDARRVLLDLSQRTGLVVASTTHGATTFRCPVIFRDLLRERARRVMAPSALSALAARTADVLAAAGRSARAFELLRALGNSEALSAFVTDEGGALLDTGRTETLRTWLEALDVTTVDANPRLRLWRGICRSYTAPREALDDIAVAHRRFADAGDTDGMFDAAVAAVESGLAQMHDLPALDPWIDLLADSIDAARTDSERLRGWYALLYAAQSRKPGQARIREGVAWVRAYAHRTQDARERLLCGVVLIYHACIAADHVLGREIIDLVAPRLTDEIPAPITRWLWHVWRGLYHLWRIEYAEAGTEQHLALGLCASHGLTSLEYVPLVNIVMIDLAQDRISDARRHLDRIEAAFTGTETMVRSFFWLGEMFHCFALGNWSGTREAMDHFLAASRRAGQFCTEMLALTDVAALHLIDGDVAAADALVREARARTANTVIRHCEGQITGLEAAIAYVEGRRDDARTLFSRTLDLIAHRGTCGCLLWARSGLSVLFSEAWQAGERPALVRELIRRYEIPPPTSFTRPWPWPVQIRAFGSLEIRIEDRLLQPDGKSQRRVLDLLRWLVADGTREVNAERIADALWPESEGDAAMTNIRVTVKRLRELLGHPEAVRVHDGKIGLNPRLVWTDTHALRELVEHLEQRLPIETSGQTIDALLFDLYRAPLLETEHQPWMDAARDRQRQRLARAVSILVQRARQDADERHAANLIERVLVRDAEVRGLDGIGPREVGRATGLQRAGS